MIEDSSFLLPLFLLIFSVLFETYSCLTTSLTFSLIQQEFQRRMKGDDDDDTKGDQEGERIGGHGPHSRCQEDTSRQREWRVNLYPLESRLQTTHAVSVLNLWSLYFCLKDSILLLLHRFCLSILFFKGKETHPRRQPWLCTPRTGHYLYSYSSSNFFHVYLILFFSFIPFSLALT